MSETPETDALASTHDEADPAVSRTSGYSDLLEFAQALEIELRASQAEVERLKEALKQTLRLAEDTYPRTKDGHWPDVAPVIFAARRALNPIEEGKS